MIGQTVSHYKILEKLGEGGMGVVYKAEDTRLKRFVALKFLPPELTRDSEARERFIQEAQTASALDHTNISTIHEIGQTDDGQMFICMTFYEGETLRETITRDPLPPEDAIDLTIQIARGLSRAHESNIIHRDIKPANVLITKRGEAKILDFGLAKLAGQAGITKVGTTMGTVAYMSPEQTRGDEVDHRADIWSLGVVLYEMVTGKRPFRGDHEHAVVYSILNEDPEPIARYRPNLPPEFQQIIDKTLTKSPDERYQKAEELVKELALLREVVVGAGPPSSTSQRTKVQRPKKPYWIFLAVAVVVVALAGILYITKILHPQDKVTAITETPPVDVVTTPESDKSIVVLPFEDISPTGDNEYFSDGLTEEIIADLSKVRELRVISRTSAMTLKGTDMNVRTIGQKLDVRYVLEGSVRKAGNDLRITAQLIDAANDAHVWADKYSGTLDDVFDLQEKVSRDIVGALKLKLSAEEDETIADRPIDNAKAYEYYFKAGHTLDQLTKDDLDRALRYIEAGLEIVGDNALLYEAMGYIHWQYFNVGIETDEAYLGKVEECARKIFDLEPDSPRAHYLLALLHMTRGHAQQSVNHFKHVLASDPNKGDALRLLAVAYGNVGKTSAAEPLIKKYSMVNPLDPCMVEESFLYLMDGKFDLALETGRRTYQMDPDDVRVRFLYVLCLIHSQSYDEAIRVCDELAEDMPEHPWARYADFMKFAMQGDEKQAALTLTPELRRIARRDAQYSWIVAIGYAILDDKKEAIDWLEIAVDLGFINYPLLFDYDPHLKTLHGEKRFEELMKRVKHEWENFEV